MVKIWKHEKKWQLLRLKLVHGMSRPIGALFHVPHGLSNAMLIKDCLEFALNGAYERFAYLGRINNKVKIQ